MRKKILAILTVLLLSVVTLKAQYVEIPDYKFKQYLEQKFPSCMSGGKLDTTCTAILNITELVGDKDICQYVSANWPGLGDDIWGDSYLNLDGLQYFKGLTKLDYNGNNCWPGPYVISITFPPNLLEIRIEMLQELQLVSPALPNNLTHFIIRTSQTVITGDGSFEPRLPDLPESLIWLDFVPFFEELPELPQSITHLDVSGGFLTRITKLPSSLRKLYCDRNPLMSLPELPDSLLLLSCTYNDELACLPPLPPTLRYLYVYETSISCLPNKPIGLSTDVTLPVCSDPSDICDVTSLSYGKIFLDKNANGVYNEGVDDLLPHVFVKSLPSGWSSSSNSYGNYLVWLDTLTSNTWSLPELSEYFTITPPSYSVPAGGVGNVSDTFDFALTPKPNKNDLSVSIGGGPFRPGFQANVHVTAENIGAVNQSGIKVKMKRPAGYSVISSTPSYSSITNDTIIWTNVSLNIFKSRTFSVQLQVPVSAELGTELVWEAWVAGSAAELTPDNNYSRWTDTVRGSFDPNDKLVNSDVLSHLYTNNDRLLYTIRFQNTGTDTAFTVVIRDVIPDNLDISTLRVVNASHPYQFIVWEKDMVEVTFPNIRLPDSNRNEPASHGFIQLSLKPNPGLPIGEEIRNSAAIYFDYNAPIITNEAITTVNIISGVASNRKLDFKVFPNPASQLLRIELPYSGKGKWLISDISGRILQENSFPSGTYQLEIPVSSFPAGTYFLTLQMGDEQSAAKVVILR